MQYTRIVLNEPHASIEGLYDEHLSFWNIDGLAHGLSLSWLQEGKYQNGQIPLFALYC